MRSRERTFALIRKLLNLAKGRGPEADSARAEADRLLALVGGVLPESDPEPVVVSLGPETPETPFASMIVSDLYGVQVGWIDGPAVVGRDVVDALVKAGRYRETCARLKAAFSRAVRRSAPAHVTSTGIVHWFGFSHEEPLTEASRASYYWGVTQGFLHLVRCSDVGRSGTALVVRPQEARPGASPSSGPAPERTARVVVKDREAIVRGRRDAAELGLRW